MLSGERDPAARIWFTGTFFYALVATVFTASPLLPAWVVGPVNSGLSVISVLCLTEALRRELYTSSPPLNVYGSILLFDVVLMALALWGERLQTDGITIHLLVISCVEIWVLWLILKVIHQTKSKALWIVFSVLLLFLLSNLWRVFGYVINNQSPLLNTKSAQTYFALILNYCSVVFYCYGYWGFVVEKNRLRAITSTENAVRAREEKREIKERAEHAATLFRKQADFDNRLSQVERQARSAAITATIAHEINQPLAAIAINVSEAQRLLALNIESERLPILMGRIEYDQKRISDLVSRIRNMFSDLPVQMKMNNIDETIISFVQIFAKNHPIISISTNLRADINFLFSRSEIEHVLQNLFQNSYESLMTVESDEKCIKISSWHDKEKVYIAIEDNGPGVDDRMKDKLFNFLESSKTDGMGLGLWLSQFIVERHGGNLVHLERTEGGAQFVLTLPLSDGDLTSSATRS